MFLDVMLSNVENACFFGLKQLFQENDLRPKKHALSPFENITSRNIEAFLIFHAGIFTLNPFRARSDMTA